MGSFAPPSRTEQVSVRVMTYNVHRCRGVDRAWSPLRIAQVIASVHPDIVGLQELDVGRARSGHIDQAEVIARDLGMDVQFFPAMRVMEEQYGDAILSRWPARLVKGDSLPGLKRMPGIEPRGALWSAIEIEGIEVQVINTHLGVLGRERSMQAKSLLGPDWLGHPDCHDPVILMGDFNTPPRSGCYRRLAAAMQDAQRAPGIRRRERTFPSRFPTLRLDHVFVRGPIEVLSATTVRTPLARLASDHLPLITELCIGAPEHRGARMTREHAGATMRPSDV